MRPLKKTIGAISLEEPISHGRVTLFPLTTTLDSTLDYLLLEQAVRDGLVAIREVSGGASVPKLQVDNRAHRPVLIVDGEELVGAKQNRVANLTLLVPAAGTTIIPVSCVEAGRWGGYDEHFVVSERVQYARGRAETLSSVQKSMRTTGTRLSDQQEVWRSIEEKADSMDADSTTGAMSAIFDCHADVLNQYADALGPRSGQVGAVFAVDGACAGLDLFDQPSTLAAFLPKLVRSYAIDAIERPSAADPPPSLAEAKAFVDRLLDASFHEHPAVGLGKDVGVVAPGLVAGALVVDETVVHLTAFAERRDPADRRGATGYANYRQRRHALHARYR